MKYKFNTMKERKENEINGKKREENNVKLTKTKAKKTKQGENDNV